jgi:hypothetical protein
MTELRSNVVVVKPFPERVFYHYGISDSKGSVWPDNSAINQVSFIIIGWVVRKEIQDASPPMMPGGFHAALSEGA